MLNLDFLWIFNCVFLNGHTIIILLNYLVTCYKYISIFIYHCLLLETITFHYVQKNISFPHLEVINKFKFHLYEIVYLIQCKKYTEGRCKL